MPNSTFIFNTTQLCSGLPEQILSNAHNLTAVPSLWIGAISTAFLLLLIGLIAFDSEAGKLKFTFVWFIWFLFSGVIFLFLSYSPNSVQFIMNYMKGVVN